MPGRLPIACPRPRRQVSPLYSDLLLKLGKHQNRLESGTAESKALFDSQDQSSVIGDPSIKSSLPPNLRNRRQTSFDSLASKTNGSVAIGTRIKKGVS